VDQLRLTTKNSMLYMTLAQIGLC